MAGNQHIWPWLQQPQEAISYDPGVAAMFVGGRLEAGRALWTPTNAPSPLLTAQGTALAFTAASSQYLKTPISVDQQNITLFAVIQKVSGATNQSILSVGAGTQRTLLYFAGTNTLALFSGAGATTGQAITAFTDTSKYHVVVARVGGGNYREIYVDGVRFATDSTTVANAVANMAAVGAYWNSDAPAASFYFGGNILAAGVLPYAASGAEVQQLSASLDGYLRYISPRVFSIPFGLAGPSASLSGTATTAAEADIVAGGKTVILTLTNDTWVAAGSAFNVVRQDIIDGIDSDLSESGGWDAQVKANQGVSGVVRTSDTIVTVTLDAQAGYDITIAETITATVPASALVSGAPIGAIPAFTLFPAPVPATTRIVTHEWPWKSIPQEPAALDPMKGWSHAIKAGVNIATGRSVSTDGRVLTSQGLASVLSMSISETRALDIPKSDSWSLLLVGSIVATSGTTFSILGATGAFPLTFIQLRNATYSGRAAFFDGVSAFVDSGVFLADYETFGFGITYDAPTGLVKWYKNGEKGNEVAVGNVGGDVWRYSSATNSSTTYQALLAFAQRALGDDEMLRATRDPGSIFAPQLLTLSLNTESPSQPTQSVGLSAVIQTVRAAQTAVDAALQSRQSAGTSIDAVVVQGLGAQASLNAAILQARSSTTGLNGYVQAGGAVSVSLDVAIQRARDAAVGIEAAVLARRDAAAALDAFVLIGANATASLDAYVQSGDLASVSVNAAVRVLRSATAEVGAAISLALQASASLDAVLATHRAAAVAVSALVQAGGRATTRMGAYIFDPDNPTLGNVLAKAGDVYNPVAAVYAKVAGEYTQPAAIWVKQGGAYEVL